MSTQTVLPLANKFTPKQLERNLLPVRDVTLMKYAFFFLNWDINNNKFKEIKKHQGQIRLRSWCHQLGSTWHHESNLAFLNLISSCIVVFVQSLSCVWLFATPWTAALQASLFFTISQSLLTHPFSRCCHPSVYGYKREEGQSLSPESLYHLKVMNRRRANKEIKKEWLVSAVQWRD